MLDLEPCIRALLVLNPLKNSRSMRLIMTREEVFVKLNEVFRDVFDDEDITVEDATTSKDVEGWDSLEHINLINAVEQEFGIRFNMGKIVTMKNVGEMVDFIMTEVNK